MSGCNRFDEEGRDRWIRGEPLDPHFETCAQCCEALDEYRKLSTLLGQSDANARPAAGWEQVVLEAVATPPARRTPRLAIAACVAILGLAAVLLKPAPSPSGFQLTVSRGDTIYRSTADVAPGDVLNVRWQGRVSGRTRMAIFVYRDGRELIGYCGADTAPCRSGDSGRLFSVPLELPGEYQSVVAITEGKIATPSDDYDQDVMTLRSLQATTVVLLPEVTVR